MTLLYDIFLFAYGCAIRLAVPFHQKAAEWVRGRSDWRIKLKEQLAGKSGKRLWMHCASLGEFEQGRPVLEAWRSRFPRHTIVLTFFSPSGFKNHKASGIADVVAYLPLDGRSASRDFLRILDPDCVLFVKYEFWHYYSKYIAERDVPLYCVSAIFRPGQVFFRSYGGFFLRILKRYSALFVQDEASAHLLRGHGIDRVHVTGDTRFDRVIQNAARPFSQPVVEQFALDRLVLVAGSTWPADEELLVRLKEKLPHICLIIAPHEIGKERVSSVCSRFGAVAVRLSRLQSGLPDPPPQVLVVDSIGLLSALYRFGKYSYVGGGFGSGIHNILEAAVYGKPVFFGPNHARFREAVAMTGSGCAFSVHDAESLYAGISLMEKEPARYTAVSEKASGFVREHAGSTERILSLISGLIPGS